MANHNQAEPIRFQNGNNPEFFLLDQIEIDSFLRYLSDFNVKTFYVQGYPQHLFKFNWGTNQISTGLGRVPNMRSLKIQITAVKSTGLPIDTNFLLGETILIMMEVV